jgi:hypothetical protein
MPGTTSEAQIDITTRVRRVSAVMMVAALVSVAQFSLVSLPQAQADAAGPGVTLPVGVTQTAQLRVLAASAGRLAVVRDSGLLMTAMADQDGGKLTYVATIPDLDAASFGQRVTDLRGTLLRWINNDSTPSADASAWHSTVHSVDLVTGEQTVTELDERVIAWTAHGWIGQSPGLVREHRDDGSSRVLLDGDDGLADAPGGLQVVTDESRFLITYSGAKDAEFLMRTVLLTADGQKVVLQDSLSSMGIFVSGMALTPGAAVWTTAIAVMYPNAFHTMHRRLDADGSKTSVEAPGALAAVVGNRAVLRNGYFDKWGTWKHLNFMWIGNGDGWDVVKRTDGTTENQLDPLGGAAVDGSTVFVALSGDIEHVAGVYRIDATATLQRMAGVESEPNTVTDVGLSAGRLIHAEKPAPSRVDATAALSANAVLRRGSGSLAGLGPSRELPPVSHAQDTSTTAVSVSGTWALLRVASGPVFMMLDGAGRSWRIDQPVPDRATQIKQSGPYALVDGTVYIPGLKFTATALSDAGTAGAERADLFGPRLVWVNSAGRVLTRDLTGSGGSRALVGSGAAGPVAVWGSRYAWLSTDGTIRVDLLKGGTEHTFKTGDVSDLRLNNDTLSWTSREGAVYVANLSTGDIQPVSLSAPYSIDDDLIAGVAADGGTRVEPLPFSTGRDRPRLLASRVPSSVVSSASWDPTFDVTKPLTLATLRIRNAASGRIVRTLRSSAAQGAVRDLRWDTRTGSGSLVRPGRYRWTLAGPSFDGDGTLVRADGAADVSGTITVLRRH